MSAGAKIEMARTMGTDIMPIKAMVIKIGTPIITRITRILALVRAVTRAIILTRIIEIIKTSSNNKGNNGGNQNNKNNGQNRNFGQQQQFSQNSGNPIYYNPNQNAHYAVCMPNLANAAQPQQNGQNMQLIPVQSLNGPLLN